MWCTGIITTPHTSIHHMVNQLKILNDVSILGVQNPILLFLGSSAGKLKPKYR